MDHWVKVKLYSMKGAYRKNVNFSYHEKYAKKTKHF